MARKPGPATEDRRNQILEAALKVFGEKGFNGATNKNIADAAGVSAGLIYFYFKNKEDLLFAILEHRVAPGNFPLPLEHMQTFPPEQVLTMIAHYGLSRLDNMDTMNVFRIFMGEAVRSEEIRALANINASRLIGTLAGYLESQMEQGRLRRADPMLCAQTFLAGLIASLIRRRFLGDTQMLSYATDEIVNTVVSIFLRGMRPD
ncbi:MAG TPA: TetR/AcrR family transcriptional regulator [Ktedonobacterales bacterium]|nr:TetR/AcrR family transcriptional regulator [Ktedonobacterales bacterium]